ncbi:hypothetical protein HYFRA_00005339 [Hymenoscyphus fraxineus]|uniref:chitinase n=1 Tax=Hymenoscyphus fraxineus TaxID=746836 RepID=A0A9N9PPR7_9HELO|nr:hypothetical protein HYFRA_00005339 [Hymenoscyphus fraxineus]
MRSSVFNRPKNSEALAGVDEWPLFTTVSETRKKFEKGTKILVAIGGWGDTDGFEEAASTDEKRELWASNVARMVENTGADGVDIDWEYPGGNGEHYLQPNQTNPTKAWQITAYPLLLAAIRQRLPPPKLITAAVPGLPRDMLAFTQSTIPLILPSLDFLNIMTYDLMNRRDNATKHHAGIEASLTSLEAYSSFGIPPEKMNVGFAFYVKGFRTETTEIGRAKCKRAWKDNSGIGCPTGLMEDPATGGDLGKTTAFSWHDTIPSEFQASFGRAKEGRKWDEVGGGTGFWDEVEDMWWTWEDEKAIEDKVKKVVGGRKIGGVFAWGLGEDGDEYSHLQALSRSYWNLPNVRKESRDEL